MNLAIDPAWATAAVLLWLRLGVVFFMTPVFSGFNGPPVLLALLSLALAGLFAAGLPAAASAVPTAPGTFAWAALLEVGLGMVLAFGVHAAFAAFGLAGQLLDLQIGFGAGNVFDPVTRANSPILGAILNSLAAMLFFTVDAHHAFVRGLAFSVTQMPPGSVSLHVTPAAVATQFGVAFSLALAMAAPILFLLVLLEAGLAVVSRMLPQMNVYFVGLPLKILVGLSAFGIAASTIGPVAGRVFASIFHFWDGALR
jgi:flagellar biosynthetic protein FliR